MKSHPNNMILFLAACVLIFLGIVVFLLNNKQQVETKTEEVAKIESLSPKTDSTTLEFELNQEKFENLDSELEGIESELSNY